MKVNIAMNTTANEILNKTLTKIDGAYAPSTIRAYRANFERFIEFCKTNDICALPADPEIVAKYVAHLTKSSLKSSSIRIAVASISSIHKLNLLDDPTQNPAVKIEMRRMHRALGRQSKQAFGITASLLEKMFYAAGDDLRGSRDRALLLLAYESMCRRSELISLRIEDIQIKQLNEIEEMKIRLRKSKTDQEMWGRSIFPSQRTAHAITEWMEKARLAEGYLFRGINNAMDVTKELKGGQINRIYKRLASEIKLPKETVEQISGHSMRIGAAQDLLKSGASLPQIMNRGRWTKPDTVMRYIENTGPFTSM